MPPQFTTLGVRIVPRSSPRDHATPVTRPSSTVTSVTVTPSMIRAPRARAPLARAIATPAGSHWPSPGRCTAPVASPTSRCG